MRLNSRITISIWYLEYWLLTISKTEVLDCKMKWYNVIVQSTKSMSCHFSVVFLNKVPVLILSFRPLIYLRYRFENCNLKLWRGVR
jgi:hypothetical protein